MSKLPRGIRNHNPGNIDFNARMFKLDPWVGELGLEQHKYSRFTTFKDPEHGIRAMCKILLTYDHHRRAKDGSPIDTVQEVIDRWAPPSENDTTAYVKNVRRLLRVEKGQEIDLNNRLIMFPLLKALIEHENGQQPYSDETILEAMAIAGMQPDLF